MRVRASQCANPASARAILDWNQAARSADVLAIAPSMMLNVAAQGPERSAAGMLLLSVDQVLDRVEAESLPQAIRWIEQHKSEADRSGLRLVAYEAGQHLVGIQGAETDDTLTELFHQANRHPRMGTIYRRHDQAWEQAGGDLLCHYSSVSRWTRWGSWGLLENLGMDWQDSPRFVATHNWARQLGQPFEPPPPALVDSFVEESG